jgi:hypothetical protein
VNGTIRLWIRDARVDSDDMLVLAGFREPIPKPRGWSDRDWREPYDDRKYDLHDVDWETSWNRALVREHGGAWRMDVLPWECGAIRGRHLGSSDGVVVREGDAWVERRIAHPRKIPMLDLVVRGDELHGVTGFVARDQVCAIDRDFRCVPVATTVRAKMQRIERLRDGRLVVAGEGIFVQDGDDWRCVREHRTAIVCALSVGPDDEILAGTLAGYVISNGRNVDVMPSSAPVTSVVRFQGEIWASTPSTIARHGSKGFVNVDVPAPRHRIGPTYGKLFVHGDRLWVAGTYALLSSADGALWEPVSFRS